MSSESFSNLFDISCIDRLLWQSVEGNGIGCVAVHPNRTHFCVCEKGVSPKIYIYEYPSMNLYKVLHFPAYHFGL